MSARSGGTASAAARAGGVAGLVLAAALPHALSSAARAQQPARLPAAPRLGVPGDSTVRPPSGTGVGIGGTNSDTTRAPGDTARRPRALGDSTRTPGDSARADSALVTFAADDSVMAALRARPGYDVVRYTGDTVRFLADERLLVLRGKPAAVERGTALLVGRTVRYDDSLRVVTALADTGVRSDSVVLRDPTQGSDVVVRGRIRYDLAERRGLVSGFSTSVAQGETWFVSGGTGAFATDSTRANTPGAGRTFYAHDGEVTSCDETTPHYHFQARDIKFVSKSLLVIRPAVLYIGNVPVMWLPFVFQDTRPGRRSGLLRPTFGVAELLRNSPNYQRSIRNLGYYTTLGDYADVRAWLDYRSGARPGQFGFGFTKYNVQSRYKVIDRFIDGDFAVGYERQSDGVRNLTLSLQHAQAFNQARRLSANINFVQNTIAQRRNAFDLYQAAGSITSSVNFQDKYGPFSLALGGQGRQTPGLPTRDLTFPTLSLTAPTISVTPWLDWTPNLSLTNAQTFRITGVAPQYASVYRPRPGGGVDSTVLNASRRQSTLNFGTPVKIFGFQWQNTFVVNDRVENFPREYETYRDINDTTTRERRVYAQSYESTFDWQTGFTLPALFQGTWNLSPNVSLDNVAGAPLLTRSQFSGGRWASGRKRVSVGVSAAPTLYAFFPGIFGAERIRNSISPTISYRYAPAARLSDALLQARNERRQGNVAAIVQNELSFGLSTNFEAKLRARPTPGAGGGRTLGADSARADSAAAAGRGAPARPGALAVGAGPTVDPLSGGSANAEGRKVKVLSLQFTTLSYNLAQSDSLTGRLFSTRGFTSNTFGINATTDLLPGFSFNTNYSLFRGVLTSDTASFKPFRESTAISFQLNRSSALLGAVTRLFGFRLAPNQEPTPSAATTGVGAQPGGDPLFAQAAARAQRAAGSDPADARYAPPTQDFQLSLSYNESRQRTDQGVQGILLDATRRCQGLIGFQYAICQANAGNGVVPGDSTLLTSVPGAQLYRVPPVRTLNAQSAFHITQKWSAQYQTSYDIVRNQFASNQVSLSRELHDWRANFSYTAAPNGNSAFSFFIALKAQPDLSFPYNRVTTRAAR